MITCGSDNDEDLWVSVLVYDRVSVTFFEAIFLKIIFFLNGICFVVDLERCFGVEKDFADLGVMFNLGQ